MTDSMCTNTSFKYGKNKYDKKYRRTNVINMDTAAKASRMPASNSAKWKRNCVAGNVRNSERKRKSDYGK